MKQGLRFRVPFFLFLATSLVAYAGEAFAGTAPNENTSFREKEKVELKTASVSRKDAHAQKTAKKVATTEVGEKAHGTRHRQPMKYEEYVRLVAGKGYGVHKTGRAKSRKVRQVVRSQQGEKGAEVAKVMEQPARTAVRVVLRGEKPTIDQVREVLGSTRDLSGCIMRGLNLAGLDMRGVKLDEADLYKANLAGANLDGASLRGASLEMANLRGASLRGAKLPGAGLFKSNLQDADLAGADLQGAYAVSANLKGAVLSSANLRGGLFTNARLDATDVRQESGGTPAPEHESGEAHAVSDTTRAAYYSSGVELTHPVTF